MLMMPLHRSRTAGARSASRAATRSTRRASTSGPQSASTALRRRVMRRPKHLKRVVDAHPEACGEADGDGMYPLHHYCKSLSGQYDDDDDDFERHLGMLDTPSKPRSAARPRTGAATAPATPSSSATRPVWKTSARSTGPLCYDTTRIKT